MQNLSAQPLTRLSQKSGWIIPPRGPFLESPGRQNLPLSNQLSERLRRAFSPRSSLNHDCVAVKTHLELLDLCIEAKTELFSVAWKIVYSPTSSLYHFVARYRGVGNLWAMAFPCSDVPTEWSQAGLLFKLPPLICLSEYHTCKCNVSLPLNERPQDLLHSLHGQLYLKWDLASIYFLAALTKSFKTVSVRRERL